MERRTLKVFISWSGERSRRLAEILGDWLPPVLQTVEPFVSTRSINKGTRWPEVLGENLENANVGIFCLTPDNLKAPWILYEAGALSKLRERSLVIPLLFGVETKQVEWPIANFNSTTFEHNEVLQMVQSLNEAAENPLRDEVVLTSFNRAWSDLERRVNETIATISLDAEPITREDNDLLAEMLELSRSQERTISHMIGDKKWTFRGNAQIDEFREADFRQLALGLAMLKTLAEIENKDYYRPVDATIQTLLKLRDPLEVILGRANAPHIHRLFFVDRNGKLAMTYTEEERDMEEELDGKF
jgi:hypothetical protein